MAENKKTIKVLRNSNRSQPVLHHTFLVNSIQSQRVIERSFASAAYSLFSIGVILRIFGEHADKRSEIDQVDTVIDALIEKVEADLEKTIEQMKKLMEDNNVSLQPNYTNPIEIEVEIISPQSFRLVKLIESLDKLVNFSDTLWFNGVLTNFQHTDINYHWQQRLIRLSGRIIGIEKRARAAAKKSGQEQAVEEAAPEAITDDAEVADVAKKVEEDNKNITLPETSKEAEMT